MFVQCFWKKLRILIVGVGMLKGCLINIHRIRGCEEYVEYLESNVVRNRYG